MNSTISDTITKEGLLIAFCSGALVAGGAVAAVSVWKNENKTMQQIVVSAAAGGAIYLGLYLWVPAAFREVWAYKG